MFHDWENFYLIVGSGAGAFISVMFVVATLTATMSRNESLAQGARVYMNPVVFHFSVILVVGATAVVPEISTTAIGSIIGATAAIGFGYSVMTTIRLHGSGLPGPPDLSDKWFYGFVPSALYIVLAAATSTVWLAPESAPYAVAVVMVALMLVGIRNAWDLATFIAQRVNEQSK